MLAELLFGDFVDLTRAILWGGILAKLLSMRSEKQLNAHCPKFPGG
jgi:hypothetical protein